MEFLTTIAYLTGGIALGFLVEMPLIAATTEARETYNRVVRRSNRTAM